MGMSNYQMLLKTVNNMLETEGWRPVVDMLQSKARDGDGSAATILGQFYEEGIGVFEDVETAIEHYTFGLDSGCVEAAGFLAELYENGDKVRQDMNQVYSVCLRGAQLGDIECAAKLANCYLHGEGTNQNPEAALDWGLKAAKAGNLYAMGTVGDIYRMLYKKPYEAYEWYARAYEEMPDEMYLLKMQAYCLVDPYEEFGITPDRAMCEKAIRLLRSGLDRDTDGTCHLFLGIMYGDGKGVPQDITAAHDYIQEAASRGNEDAAELLPSFRRNIFGGYSFR